MGRVVVLTPEQQEAVNAMLCQGVTMRSIAEQIGTSKSTIHRFANREGKYGEFERREDRGTQARQ